MMIVISGLQLLAGKSTKNHKLPNITKYSIVLFQNQTRKIIILNLF